jgi:CheY-like chemotaxis protein
MNLTEKRLEQLEPDAPILEQSVLSRCKDAAELINNGQYEVAKDTLGDLWRGVGEKPNLEGLDSLTSAEVLLQCGILTGWLGSAKQVKGSQERAKDLIFESLRLFQSHNRLEKVSEAQYQLGICYWREGAFGESCVMLQEALNEATSTELKAKISILSSIVLSDIGRYHDALQILKEAELFFESCDDVLKGNWHGQMGLVLRRLGTIERRANYFDRAIIEYTAAIYYYEKAGHERHCARNLNNLAFLLYKLKHYKEAHENLNRAAEIFSRLNDQGSLAQVEETKARVFLAEGRFNEADFLITDVIRKLEHGGEQSLLADALTVQGIVWARLERHDRSICKLRDAMDTAVYAGALHNAGLATLTLIEEHGAERLTEEELYDFYFQADEFLKDTQDAEDIARLRFCARLVTERLYKAQANQSETFNEKISLPDVLHSFEAKLIEKALQVEDGSVSRAAKRLGIKHQSLAHLLSTRHHHLLTQRTPIVKRRRSIIKLREPRHTAHCEINPKTRLISILHVEDNPEIAMLVKDIILREGWLVETCAEGRMALQLLESENVYDLVILDNDLPDTNGIELARRARQLEHRRNTPIVMFSGNFDEQEALDAGIDLALRKPEDTLRLITKIQSLGTVAN